MQSTENPDQTDRAKRLYEVITKYPCGYSNNGDFEVAVKLGKLDKFIDAVDAATGSTPERVVDGRPVRISGTWAVVRLYDWYGDNLDELLGMELYRVFPVKQFEADVVQCIGKLKNITR